MVVQDSAALLERPFYFIVVLWGERFRNHFLDLCRPTLLGPGNLASLNTREPQQILICTRPEDGKRCRGDREVIRWLSWRTRELAYYLGGRTLQRGKPRRPHH